VGNSGEATAGDALSIQGGKGGYRSLMEPDGSESDSRIYVSEEFADEIQVGC
jgi:hypothetical protein